MWVLVTLGLEATILVKGKDKRQDLHGEICTKTGREEKGKVMVGQRKDACRLTLFPYLADLLLQAPVHAYDLTCKGLPSSSLL